MKVMASQTEMHPACKGLILYASYQEGVSLTGYVRYALDGLVRTGFPVVMITNQGDLDGDSRGFLSERGITLFATENRGFDFGMWRRYLATLSESDRGAIERLVLVNDSVVYFRDVFPDLFERAEGKSADMVSLSSNEDYGFHLQSFFLYMKPRAIAAFLDHLFTADEQGAYWDAVMNLEVGLSRGMLRRHLVLEPLYRFDDPFDFSYEKLIRMQAGFVKRKLLEKRYTFGQTLFFLRNNRRALDLDYRALILEQGGMDVNFRPEWLTTRPPATLREKARRRFWRVLFWGWTAISDASLLAAAVAIGMLLAKQVGNIGGVLGGVVGAVFLFRARWQCRKWVAQRSVRPIDAPEG
jgi:hypothetical protein